MALFSKKTIKEAPKGDKIVKAAKTVKVEKSVAVTTTASAPSIYDALAVIVAPLITEKAAIQSEKGVYVFEISKDATKPQIARAIAQMYKVTPAKVRVVTIPAKKVFVRGKVGMKSGYRKAYVTLKAGDKIEIA